MHTAQQKCHIPTLERPGPDPLDRPSSSRHVRLRDPFPRALGQCFVSFRILRLRPENRDIHAAEKGTRSSLSVGLPVPDERLEHPRAFTVCPTPAQCVLPLMQRRSWRLGQLALHAQGCYMDPCVPGCPQAQKSKRNTQRATPPRCAASAKRSRRPGPFFHWKLQALAGLD